MSTITEPGLNERSGNQVRPTEVHRDEYATICYTNHITVETSNFDVKLRIGLLREVNNIGEVVVKDQAHVYLSHEHFQAFARVVSDIAGRLREANQPVIVDREDFLAGLGASHG